MEKTLAIVLAGGRGERLIPLTVETPKPVIPFAGTYRLIDFTIGNVVNTRILSAWVITRAGATRVEAYVERLRGLLLDRLGYRLEAVAARQPAVGVEGTAEAVAQVLPAALRHRTRDVLVLASDHVYRMDYTPMVEAHRATGAGVTVAAVPMPPGGAERFGVIDAGPDLRIRGFVEKPLRVVLAAGRAAFVSMGVYVFDPAVLSDMLERDAGTVGSVHDFGRDILPVLTRLGRAWVYPFRGYWRDVGTLESYFAAHRDFLRPPAGLILRDPAWPILGAAWPLLPGPAGVNRHGALVSPGCLCEAGSRVLASTLSPAVRVGHGAVVEDCVLLDGATIGAGARLRRVIVDKGVSVPGGVTLGCDPGDGACRVVSGGTVLTFGEAGPAGGRANPRRGTSAPIRARRASSIRREASSTDPRAR